MFRDALLKSNVVLLCPNVSLKPGALLNGEASVFPLPVLVNLNVAKLNNDLVTNLNGTSLEL
jgi:hypothetical protein